MFGRVFGNMPNHRFGHALMQHGSGSRTTFPLHKSARANILILRETPSTNAYSGQAKALLREPRAPSPSPLVGEGRRAFRAAG